MENDHNTQWLTSIWKKVYIYIEKKGKPILKKNTNIFKNQYQGL